MCGIFCLISALYKNNTTLLEKFKLYEKSLSKRGPDSLKTEFFELADHRLLFASSVLWLQGTDITPQPLKSKDSIFVYNGDVFGGLISDEVRTVEGDTKPFWKAIENSDNLLQQLHNIQGPYAFIYLNFGDKKLYFGRDIYGRRSLLIGKHENEFIITSIAKRNTKFKFIELPSIGTFTLNFSTQEWRILPWKRKNKNFSDKLQELELFLSREIKVDTSSREEASTHFLSPDKTQLYLHNTIVNHKGSNTFEILCNNSNWLGNILKLKELLRIAVRKRISTQPSFCQNCFRQYRCNHSLTGVLFSGGVDCAILALLADEFTDENRSIDLINVAFDKVANYKTPDRITGMDTLEELKLLRPQRKWNFVEVNVTREELDFCRTNNISDLIYPLQSILDDSLGCALWFASRAKTDNYTSPCRILLVGMGADELFGGYTRHRAALQKGSWQGLHEVLEEDWQNLSHRNLARDDRVVSDHGRQLRTPYLDEEVVEFVRSLHCWERTFPSNDLPRGIGEKILLRSLAFHLGLKNAASLQKRALQFGSRIANPKEKAHEVSGRL